MLRTPFRWRRIPSCSAWWIPDCIRSEKNMSRTENVPAPIAAILGNQAGKTDGLGKSGAQVLLFDDYVLKIRSEGSRDTGDVKVLRAAAAHLFLPLKGEGGPPQRWMRFPVAAAH